jgi:hypothetical protein
MIGAMLALAMMQAAPATAPAPSGPVKPVLQGIDCPHFTPRRQPLSVMGVCQPAKPTPGHVSLVPAAYWNADLAALRWSGLAADAASLKLAEGAIPAGGEVVRIQVRQAYGGRLTHELNGRTLGGDGRRVLPVDTPVYGLADFSQPGLAGPIFIWCAPATIGKKATTPDRALCFIDRRQHNKVSTGIPFMPLNVDKMNTVVMSKPGESPYAPDAIDFAYSPPVKPAEAEPTGEPYPIALTLIVRWTPIGATGVRFDAILDDGSGPRPFRTWTEAETKPTGGPIFLAGGLLRYRLADGALVVTTISPVENGALIHFTPDRSAGFTE